jgi:exodeoxyribonuclease-3
MLIVSLNIRHGGGRRVRALLDWLISLAPSIIVLPEWRDDMSGEFIKRRLEAADFFVGTAVSPRSRSNGVLVATKIAFQSERITPSGSERGELLLAHVAPSFRLLAAYFPQNAAKAPFFRVCMAEAANSSTIPFILLGDLNTGHNDLDIEGSGTPFYCADLFDALRSKARLVDLWRAEHGDRREWTWRSRINGFRIDHAFVNTAFVECFPSIQCLYDHHPRETGLTDHSALLVSCAQLAQQEAPWPRPLAPGPAGWDQR